MCNKKICKVCNIEKIENIENFGYSKSKGRYINSCRMCENERKRFLYIPKSYRKNEDGTLVRVKKCHSCGVLKDATDENFKSNENGIFSVCIECLKNVDSLNTMPKECKKCKNIKTLADFPFEKDRFIYSSQCKSCTAESARQYRIKAGITKNCRLDTKDKFKKCYKCGIEKKLISENYRRQRNGWSNVCVDCLGQDPKYGSSFNSEWLKEEKECCDCNISKLLIEYSFSKPKEKFSSRCKSCERKRQKLSFENLTMEEQYEKILHKKVKRVMNFCRSFDNQKILEFNLTEKYVRECLEKPCIYCGYPSTGLDRNDNSIGHTIDNTLPCCKECNVTKMNNYTTEEMRMLGEVIKKIKDNRNNG